MKVRNKLMLSCFTVITLLLGFSLAAGQPYLQRGGANLVSPNPDLNGTAGWALSGSSVYDPNLSRDADTGSVRMSIPYPSAYYSHLESGLIPVTPGKTYTLSFYMRSDIFPPPGPVLFVGYYNADGSYVRNSLGSDQAVTARDSWQECVFLFRPQPGEVFLKIKTTLMFQPLNYPPGSVWLDNFYLGEGIGFGQEPSPKSAFDGALTRIDQLGNVEIYRDSTWVPFFPIGIYGDNRRDNWGLYSQQGFNTQMWASSYDTILKAKNATSGFNPAGMMSGFQISDYTNTGGYNYGNISLLGNRIRAIADNNLMDSLLWYYWDNENSYSEWDNPLAVINRIKELDVDAGGNRMHPIYALQGNEGIARKYKNSNAWLTDIVGSYVTDATTTASPDESRGALKLVTLDHVEQQRNPVVMAQITHGIGMLFRPRVFAAIAKGAKGIGFWKDDVDGGASSSDAIPVQNQPWWEDLPNIRREIDQLLPIIRMPHWTNWSLRTNNSLIEYGSRDFQGKAYVIVANEMDSAQSVTFTISNLPYAAGAVRDFFTNQVDAIVSDDRFTVTIPAYGSKVYLLENKPAPVTVSAWPTASAIVYGQPLGSSTLTGGAASVPGTFAFTTPAAVPSAGVAPQGIVFTPTDAGTYSEVYGTVYVMVDKATATVVLGDLNFTHDGSPHSVTATTTPTGLAYTVTYNGSTTPPTEAGSYTVVATVSDPNYHGSSTGTMTIAAPPAMPVPALGPWGLAAAAAGIAMLSRRKKTPPRSRTSGRIEP